MLCICVLFVYVCVNLEDTIMNSPWDSPLSTRLKRKGNRSGSKASAECSPPADVTILFCHDALEWDTYLTDCLNHFLQTNEDGSPCIAQGSDTILIRHEKLEEIPLSELPPSMARSYSASKVTLVIISPDLVNFIESHAHVYEVCKHLKPSNTIAMLCGVKEKDISFLHRAALASYDGWHRMVAKDQDKDFVLSAINTIRGILTRVKETARLTQRPCFKITPRKVKEGHNKVFIILDQPIDPSQKISVLLDSEGTREVDVKIRNPYTLQFAVPESFLKVSKILNVHVRCQGILFGIHPLKVESLTGELSSILSSVDSPYELLCRALGLFSRHKVDAFLVEKFRQRLPKAFQDECSVVPIRAGLYAKTKEELPTLLHFSACYGLKDLTRLVLSCPGGKEACTIQNANGLTPIQLANQGRHHDVASVIHECEQGFLRMENHQTAKINPLPEARLVQENPTTWCIENQTYYANTPNNSASEYDFPALIPIPVPQEATSSSDWQVRPTDESMQEVEKLHCQNSTENFEEDHYLVMKPYKKPSDSALLPHQLLLQGKLDIGQEAYSEEEYSTNLIETENKKEHDPDEPSSSDHQSSQSELIAILERFKKGREISFIEKDCVEWHKKYAQLKETEGSLEPLKDAYKKKNPTTEKVSNGKKNAFGFKFLLSKNKNPSDQTDKGHSSFYLDSPPVDLNKLSLENEFDDNNRPISTLSSGSSCHSRASTASSFSTASICSNIYDSGNHSDSCDESHKLNGRLGKSRLPISVEEGPTHSVLVNKISLSQRAPVPPPRPPPRGEAGVQGEIYEPIKSPTYVCPDLRFSYNSKDCYDAGHGDINSLEEECYWVPPPPIPVWQKSQETCPIVYDEMDYDVPKKQTSFHEEHYSSPRNNFAMPDKFKRF